MRQASVAAELWALRDGIKLCVSLKLQAIIIELDAQLVVDFMNKDAVNLNGNSAIVEDCKNSLRDIPMVGVQHCFREENKCADALARRGPLLGQDFVIFLEPLANVALLLGVQFDHFVSSRVSAV